MNIVIKIIGAFILGIAVGIVWWKPFTAIFERLVAPGYSTCEKCGRPWKFVDGHDVMFNESEGMFAVCEDCWNNSTLIELKSYYSNVYKSQLEQGMPDDHYKALMDSVEVAYYHTKFHQP